MVEMRCCNYRASRLIFGHLQAALCLHKLEVLKHTQPVHGAAPQRDDHHLFIEGGGGGGGGGDGGVGRDSGFLYTIVGVCFYTVSLRLF